MADLPFDQQLEYELLQGVFNEGVGDIDRDRKTGFPSFPVRLGKEAEAEHEICITVTLPVGYPEAAPPMFEFECLSVSRRIQPDRFLTEANAMVAENSGMPIIMMVLQRMQDLLLEMDADKQKKLEDAAASDTRDPTVRLGQPLTIDMFKRWQVEHTNAKAAKQAATGGGDIAGSSAAAAGSSGAAVRLTGRQLWDTTLRNADWQLFSDVTGPAGEDADDEDFVFELPDEDEEGLEGGPDDGMQRGGRADDDADDGS
mgnify:CR=1 FL=1